MIIARYFSHFFNDYVIKNIHKQIKCLPEAGLFSYNDYWKTREMLDFFFLNVISLVCLIFYSNSVGFATRTRWGGWVSSAKFKESQSLKQKWNSLQWRSIAV